jgi:hypothetical protein
MTAVTAPAAARTFVDDDLEARFRTDGLVIVPLLPRRQVRRLRKRYAELVPETPPGCISTLYDPDPAHKQAVAEALEPLAEGVLALLEDHQVLVSGFVAKQAGDPTSAMPAHQDWTFVDERRWRSLSVWCPLVDTCLDNGALHIMRGGHELPFTIRGTEIPSAFHELGDDVHDHLSPLLLRAGEAVVYDHRMVHASPSNRTSKDRVAGVLALVPRSAEPLHYGAGAHGGTIVRYAVGPDFFFDHTYGEAEMPPSAQVVEVLQWPVDQLGEAELVHLPPVEPLRAPRRRH